MLPIEIFCFGTLLFSAFGTFTPQSYLSLEQTGGHACTVFSVSLVLLLHYCGTSGIFPSSTSKVAAVPIVLLWSVLVWSVQPPERIQCFLNMGLNLAQVLGPTPTFHSPPVPSPTVPPSPECPPTPLSWLSLASVFFLTYGMLLWILGLAFTSCCISLHQWGFPLRRCKCVLWHGTCKGSGHSQDCALIFPLLFRNLSFTDFPPSKSLSKLTQFAPITFSIAFSVSHNLTPISCDCNPIPDFTCQYWQYYQETGTSILWAEN